VSVSVFVNHVSDHHIHLVYFFLHGTHQSSATLLPFSAFFRPTLPPLCPASLICLRCRPLAILCLISPYAATSFPSSALFRPTLPPLCPNLPCSALRCHPFALLCRPFALQLKYLLPTSLPYSATPLPYSATPLPCSFICLLCHPFALLCFVPPYAATSLPYSAAPLPYSALFRPTHPTLCPAALLGLQCNGSAADFEKLR